MIKIIAKVILLGLICFVSPISEVAAETAINGKVVSVSPKVKIEYKGQYAPNVGDPVEIGFKLEEDFIPVEGNWKIEKVELRYVWLYWVPLNI